MVAEVALDAWKKSPGHNAVSACKCYLCHWCHWCLWRNGVMALILRLLVELTLMALV